MPRVRKFDRDKIIETALMMVQKDGLESLNARNLAANLGASVQPIFHNFKNMDELIEEVKKKIYEKYKEYMNVPIETEKAYKKIGLGYIRFAKDYKEYFKILFMQKTVLDAEEFVMADSMGDAIIKAGQKLTGFSYEEQKKFHVRVWIFTHGLACLVAMKTIDIDDEKIASLLEETVRGMAVGFKQVGGEN